MPKQEPSDAHMEPESAGALSSPSATGAADASQQACERRQNRSAWLIAIVAMLTTLIPYLVGASMANGRRFMWLGYNLDDSCVYLSWMRQAADGSSHALNLFTTDLQNGMALNPLFLVLGRLAGWTHLPLIAVYHGSRLLFGLLLLRLVWQFITLTVAEARARKLAFLFACFSSGLGWLPSWWLDSPIQTPIDKWQPEAITYLSLYLSPLFCFSLALQVGILTLLFRGLRSGEMRFAVGAGFCGLLLGLVHTYDIVSLSAVWLVYLAVHTLTRMHSDSAQSAGKGWLQAAVAGAITTPSVLYIYHQLNTEVVFRTRAEVKTLAPSLIWVLLGYGLTLVFALYAAVIVWRRRPATGEEPPPASAPLWTTGRDASLLLVIWAVINTLICYLPTAIQRKLLQGAHFPIAILAGIGAICLLAHFKPNAKRWQVAFKMAMITLVLSLTNVLFMLRDIGNYEDNLSQTRLQRTYLQPGEIEALEWIRDHSAPADALQPLPWISRVGTKIAPEETVACFTPGLIDRHVYCGHWGETPDFGSKLQDIMNVALGRTLDETRRELLRKMHVRYLLFSQKSANDEAADATQPQFRGLLPLPDYLHLVHSNADADVYEVAPNL